MLPFKKGDVVKILDTGKPLVLGRFICWCDCSFMWINEIKFFEYGLKNKYKIGNEYRRVCYDCNYPVNDCGASWATADPRHVTYENKARQMDSIYFNQ